MDNPPGEEPRSRVAEPHLGPRVTSMLVGLYVSFMIVDLFQTFLGQPHLTQLGLFMPALVHLTEGGPAPFLLGPFLHAGVTSICKLPGGHLIANVVLLLMVGNIIDRLYGRWRAFAAYLLSALVGMAASGALLPEEAFYAASAGTCGLVGLLLGLTVRSNGVMPVVLAPRIITFLALAMIAVLSIGVYEPLLNNVVHAGGLVTGFLLAFVLRSRVPLARSPRLAGLAALAIAVAFGGFLAVIPRVTTGTLAAVYLEANDLTTAGDRLRASAILEQVLATEQKGSISLLLLPSVQNHLAWLYVELNDNLDRGVLLSLESNRASPGNPQFLDTLGYLYAVLGQCRDAADAMGRAASIDPRFNGRRDEIRHACETGEPPDLDFPIEEPAAVTPSKDMPVTTASLR